MSFNVSAGLAPLHPVVDDTAPVPLPPHHLRNLHAILQRANDFYHQLAIATRDSRRPTHHAKSYASKIGLTVDINKAANCPQREVSRIPLPIVDTTLGPNTPSARSAVQDLYGPFDEYRVVGSGPVISYDISGVCHPAAPPKRRSTKDLPPIIIPAVGSDRRRVATAQEKIVEMYVSPTQPSSYFSAITPDTNVHETPVFNIHIWDSAMSLQHTERIVSDHVILGDDKDKIGEEIILTPMSAMSEGDSDWEDDKDNGFVLEEMDCSQDMELYYPAPTSSVSLSSGSSNSGSTSSTSFSGLATPSEGSPITVCNKHQLEYQHEITLGSKPPKLVRKDIQMGISSTL
ncbi:hypothetical protein E1B28_009765 [Marasmius oreades]|uniref:Uncharacterized protein n=1 Tax=Marasmius oreades TaxID=181124 RepID=A0A9P7RWV6_9AGAR|nr:uncharacterized protein E1B28_009765 [Marasmius oreades]KAG7090666.1 hypothetical protein E1B28_009765 [Marasmius oreades]